MDKKENKNNISFMWLRFIPVLVVITILVSILSAGPFSKERATTYKNHYNPAYDFTLEPENKIDIVCIGSSNMFTAFSPAYIYENYGYTACDIGMSYQTPVRSYSFLTEFLKTQSPKILILDTDMLYDQFPTEEGIEEIDAKGEKNTYEVLREKQETLFSGISDARFTDIIGSNFSMFQLNDHWKHWRDFLPKAFISSYTDEVDYPCEHGFKYRDEVVVAKKSKLFTETEKLEEIDYEYRIYYQKIIDLCKEKGIEVWLVEMPTVRSWSTQRHNAVDVIAAENNIEFIDFNYLYKDIKLNLKKDFFDGKNHLNYRGAKKVSKYLGEKLTAEGMLTDHRGDEEYAFFEESVTAFKTKYGIK
ncbi:MAG: SGNH/GDSL hydrolase family protein [Eubacterium sp.]|nr:SGNH/GDSL hydrolase family protein [Eubacterium sp.]